MTKIQRRNKINSIKNLLRINNDKIRINSGLLMTSVQDNIHTIALDKLCALSKKKLELNSELSLLKKMKIAA